MKSILHHGLQNKTQQRARDLLHTLSWRVERLFRKRGHLHTYLWVTEDVRGHREWFEIEWTTPAEIDDATALTALRAGLREDFARDRIARYGVAFPARMTQVLRQSILHLDGEEVQRQVICLEAHDHDLHLRTQREIHNGRLTALTAIEEAPGCFGLLRRS